MASSTVYKDITKFKPKFFGKDLRNIFGIIGIGASTVLNIVNAIFWHFPQMFTYMTIAVIAVPAFIFGFGTRENMPLERYIKRLFIYYMSYRSRDYQTEKVKKYDYKDFTPLPGEKEY